MRCSDDDNPRGCRRVRKDAKRVYFSEFEEDFKGFQVDKTFQICGEHGQLKATCKSFSDDDDVLEKRCQHASAGFLEAP